MARPRGSHPTHSTSEDRSRRRTLTAILVVGVLALLGWIAAISALTGGEDSTGGAQQASSKNRVAESQSPETTREAPESTNANSGGNSGEEDASQDRGGEKPEPTAKDVPVEESPSGDWQQGKASEGEPAVASGSNTEEASASNDAPEPPDQPEEQEKNEARADGPQQQQLMDPLGKNPEPGDLTETEKERVKSAADRFITAAFGYTGDSEKEYRQGILDAALAQGLYRSPGGKNIEEYAEAAGEDGITSAAVMDRFEITRTEPNQVEGIAHFRVGKEYNQYAELEGETTAFTQKLTLSPAYSAYLVSWAEVEREVPEGDNEQGGN